MMKITAVLVILGLASASAVLLSATCGKPTFSASTSTGNGTSSGSGSFDFDSCTAAEYAPSTSYQVTCSQQGEPAKTTFTYKLAQSDKSGPLFFVVSPTGVTTSTTKFHITTTVPSSSFLGLGSYSNDADTVNSKQPLVASSNLVSWIDAETTYNTDLGTTATFDVTCKGNTNVQTFDIALFQGGITLEWSDIGTPEGTYGAKVYGGVPCCGIAQASWALNGVATEHVYIDAKLTQANGKWKSATMNNVGVSLDNTENFDGNGFGMAKVRTCMTNQSCTTKAEVYYISATTADSSDQDGWVSLELTLRASAGAVGVSIVTVAAVIIANLL
jgi:hypothetical protein